MAKSKRKASLGVFVQAKVIKQLEKQQADKEIEDIKNANNHVGLTLFFFSTEDIHISKKTISGTYFNPNKSLWERKEFNYPNLIYKRNSNKKSQRKLADIFERQLREEAVIPINYLHGFNKWEVYQNLSKNNEFKQYLPQTILFKNANDLKRLLSRGDIIYLKACRGGRGRQVVSASKLPDGGYKYSYFNNKLFVNHVDSFDELLHSIKTFFGHRKFIIQRGIELISINNRLIDFRGEVQRDNKGNITIAAVAVRIGNDKSPITTHADCFTLEEFFKKTLIYTDEDYEKIKNQIYTFLTLAYSSIERAFGKSGEIGIDFGLDKEGRLWFIECNACSLKVSFYRAYDKKTIKESYINLLEYGIYRLKNRQ